MEGGEGGGGGGLTMMRVEWGVNGNGSYLSQRGKKIEGDAPTAMGILDDP